MNLPEAEYLATKPKSAPGALAESAYQHLRLGLLEGALSPGDKLGVTAIAAELNCSRVPIMEALKRLEREGFVDIKPQVGCRVSLPSRRDILDFFELFAAAEGTVTAFAAQRRTIEELDEFDDLCSRIATGCAQAKGPGEADPTYRRFNLAFHGFIHRMARTPVVTSIAGSLWDRSDFYIKLAFGSLYFSSTVKRSHKQIRQAISNGDAPAARDAVSEHLLGVGRRVAKKFDSENLHEYVESNG